MVFFHVGVLQQPVVVRGGQHAQAGQRLEQLGVGDGDLADALGQPVQVFAAGAA
jgi:hypothetical protein